MNKSMFFHFLIDSLLLLFANNSISFNDLLKTLTFSFEAHNLRSTYDVFEFSLIVMKNSSSELFKMFETFEKTIETRKDFTTKLLKRCICSTNVLDA